MSRKSISNLSAVYANGKVRLNWYKATIYFQSADTEEFREFRIFRRRITKFEFGKDYKEYFSDYHGRFGKVIYRGIIKCENKRKFTFYDKEVENR